LKFTFLDALLEKSTALLAAEHDAVCIFVNDICDEAVLQKLSALGVVRKIVNGQAPHFSLTLIF
jgi:D-lactate dehydrogenase